MIFSLVLAGISSALGLVYSQLLVKLLTSLSSNFVLAQTMVLGVYIAAMGIGAVLADRVPQNAIARRLPVLQLAMGLVGLLAVFWVYTVYFVYKFYFLEISFVREREEVAIFVWALIIFTQPVVAGIGLLAGLELNLLVRLGQQFWPSSGAGKILAASYAGTAAASLVFVWILPLLATPATFFALASLNLIFAVALSWLFSDRATQTRHLAAAAGLALVLAVITRSEPQLEQFEAKAREIQGLQVMRWLDLPKVLRILAKRPTILRHNTGYQIADFSFQVNGNFHFLLDHHAQIERSWLDMYHEGLIDFPIQLFRQVPKRVLILGGGDGVAAGQLFRYGDRIEKIDLVDLDPWMLKTASTHPFFTDLNHFSYSDPRLNRSNLDAIQVLRGGSSLYDMAIIDFPLPFEVELTKLYSREFYQMVARRLKPDGMLILDTPLGCYRTDPFERKSGQWHDHSRASLKAAELNNITAYCSGDGFLIARKDDLKPQFSLVDMGVTYKWLNPETFEAAFDLDTPPPGPISPSANTIFKPNRPLRAREM